MATDILRERFDEIEALAKAAGLKHYDVHFFEVPASVIYEVASYGLPTRYSHWSFGKIYQHQQSQHEMGHAKIYELILNNDPSYAFLDKTNTDTTNLMIAAHCYGHSDFFANNANFMRCGETNMIQVAKQHAEQIDEFRKEYGDDEVDEWLDVALALDRHIDIFRGLSREPYPKRHVEYEERLASKWEDVYDRNYDKTNPLVKRTVKGLYLPPHPEKDILWFLSHYCNLESWQQKIFEIVRRESYYFYPQYRTKIMNEGWASYWHAELMHQYALGNNNDYGVDIKHPLTPEEHLDFLSSHEKVVQPGLKLNLKVEQKDEKGNIYKTWAPWITKNPHLFSSATRLNPYYVGFRIFRDIKERWDEYYHQGYMENEWGEEVEVKINGAQKIREVMEEEDDVSFLRNYLTEELADELHLFSYGNNDKYDDSYDIQENINKRYSKDDDTPRSIDSQIIENKTYLVRSKKLKDIINGFAKQRSNYSVPAIVIRRVDEAGVLRLEHTSDDNVNIDIKYAEHVLRYVHRAWGRPVELIRKDTKEHKTWLLTFDGYNFEIDYNGIEWPDNVEKKQSPSSW